jgi:hypothetical protein
LQRLKRENATLREEREILKKAAAWFARETGFDPAMVFEFMKAHQAAHSIPTLCRVLGVSASGYYAWVARRPSRRATKDAELLEHIRDCHRASRGTYGTPRIHRDVRAAGVCVGRKRVARLLKQAGLRA